MEKSSKSRVKGRRCSTRKSRLCLFCLQLAPEEDQVFSVNPVKGTSKCSLQNQLQSFFVIREILDLPLDWCEKYVGGASEEESPRKVDNEETQDYSDSVIYLCSTCFKLVQECWSLHQNIISLQALLKGMKEQLKGVVVDSLESNHFQLRHKGTIEVRQLFLKSIGKFRQDKPEAGNEVELDLQDNDYDAGATFDDDLDYNYDGDDHDGSDGEPPKKRKQIKRTSLVGAGAIKKRVRTRTRKKRKFPFPCETCPARYLTEEEFTEHQQAHEKNRLNNGENDCPTCHFPCSSAENLESHKTAKHGQYKISQKKMTRFKCKECEFSTYIYFRLEVHMENHKDGSTDECKVTSLECDICHQKLANASAYSRHRRNFHPEVFGSRSDKVLECTMCHQRFDHEIRFQQHLESHEKKKVVNLEYTCEVCGKGFRWKSRLNQHMISHGAKTWICSICGTDYTHKNSLGLHYRSYHPDLEPPFPVSFKPGDKKIITPVQEFTCDVCHKQIPSVFRRRHLKQHVLDGGGGYPCDLCERIYTNTQALNRHKEIKHSEGTKEAQCPYCNKTFVHREHVNMHLRYCRVKISLQAGATVEESTTTSVNSTDQQKIEIPYTVEVDTGNFSNG